MIQLMKTGDLVKRSNTWKEWMKHNSWMTPPEFGEVGIIINVESVHSTGGGKDYEIHVLWSETGMSCEDRDDLEIVNESI